MNPHISDIHSNVDACALIRLMHNYSEGLYCIILVATVYAVGNSTKNTIIIILSDICGAQ